ncbi:MAG: acyl-ACP--UDP-N-acetylglucosamine O-acyltransferase [Opitutales bacterium]|nr:acyl-ACP--UDP-N-acetylglucosamine O-acyltransferase [Opitutales bacterium]
MGVNIHSSAIVDPKAKLGENVVIDAFAMIGPQASIGDNCRIFHHATVEGRVTLGSGNLIHSYSLIGGLTHDLKYQGGEPGLEIGDNNIFREYVTAHVATEEEDLTVIGSDNVFLAYSHVAHDCQVGNHLIMSSHSALGGHVVVQDHVNVGWNAGVHQFCRLGKHCMVSACSKLVQDVPPYMLADGFPAEVRSINKIGMERNGFSSDEIDEVRGVFKKIYKSDYNRSQALAILSDDQSIADKPVLNEIIDFIQNSGRGVA